ncbi:MAG: hypothetical protein R2747_04375 [Pyrinomonadaceae bacterium]
MDQLEKIYEVSNKDLLKEKGLRYGAIASPLVLSIVPAVLFFVLGLLFSSFFFFLSPLTLVGGFVLGLIISVGLLFYRSSWLKNIRERIAVDGIRAEEVDWFKNEMTSEEKKALKEIESRNLLLADAYRDTLAARLTATRIKKATNRELLLAKKRQNKVRYLKSDNSKGLLEEIETDIEKLQKIKTEADEMKVEAQTRLQMIEGTARRGTDLAGTELILKKLSARTSELPLALETAKMEEEYRKEFEKEFEKELEEQGL